MSSEGKGESFGASSAKGSIHFSAVVNLHSSPVRMHVTQRISKHSEGLGESVDQAHPWNKHT